MPGLATRDTEARELMDDPACDLRLLRSTYAQFRLVNRAVSGWRRVYVRRLRPLLSADRPTSLLDIGFGGGDVPRALAGWARRDGLLLDVTAIDPDERACAFAAATPSPDVLFLQATSSDLVAAGERFDLVVSNHLLHHLDGPGLAGLLADSAALARRLVVHNDIERSPLAYAAWSAATFPLRGRSFVHVDGRLSIRRSYRRSELAAHVPDGWSVERQRPYRLLLVQERA
ncbi:class I SAM-dependent methyltransferase [Motilibacter aurantiacus]|uniref:class I SAM-dependent methyltransferase n=1 Tax=Motilibacter aurantiacus TaxID=2714955 RepID=UPI0014079F37|nr:class I SAM-dependent methyltransferase [Motilibacter aurantiacus]NHC44234.1 methyltransferase domain-containing protein [Motilibacter aurantiacus]